MLNYCQKVTDDGLDECGFLIGNICKANREKEFRISADFLRCLKIVGCQSWQRYLDYERRERIGNSESDNAVGECKDSRENRPRTTASHDRKQHEMSELQQPEMGMCRNCWRNYGNKTVPMRILQEDSDCNGNTNDNRSIGKNMTPHLQCFICGKNAIAKSEDGFYLCTEHYEKRKEGKTLKELKDKEEGR